jgi:hypothetical protein
MTDTNKELDLDFTGEIGLEDLDPIENENEGYNQYLEEAEAAVNRRGGDFTVVLGQRVVSPSGWFDGGSFVWNVVYTEEGGNKKPVTDELLTETNYTRLGGVIVHSEIKSSLNTPGSTSPKDTVCSVIGYKKKDKDPNTGEIVEKYIEGLPQFPTFLGLGMYGGWNNATKSPDYYTASEVVKNFDLVGSRGEKCKDCIKNGHSHLENGVKKDGTPKYSDCSPYGRLFFYCTHIGTAKRMIKISELYPGEDGILLIISLPYKVGLKGVWDQDAKKRRISYFRYLYEIFSTKSTTVPASFKDPKILYTMISIEQPVEDEKASSTALKNNKKFLTFKPIMNVWTSKNREAWKESLNKAHALWNSLNPSKEEKELNLDEVLQGFEGSSPVEAQKESLNSTDFEETLDDNSTTSEFDEFDYPAPDFSSTNGNWRTTSQSM